jgi:hypothetical protein
MFAPLRGNTIKPSNGLSTKWEKCMNKSAIRLLMIAMFAMASAAVPVTTPAKAATDGSTAVKKKHKKMSPAGTEAQTPKTSSQYPPNMNDDPSRKISY